MAEQTTNARGFHGYDLFQDDRRVRVKIYESSAASGPHVWVDVEDTRPEGQGIYGPGHHQMALHLNPSQAKRLIGALQRFVDEAPGRWGR